MLIIAIFMLCIHLILPCDAIENGWKGIKPLQTTKVEVEKLLAPPVSDKDGFYGYRTPDAFIHIEYSETPCTDRPWKRGRYSVSPGTVINYTVTLKKHFKLSDLKFDRDKFERDDGEGHIVNVVSYGNEEAGVGIEVYVENETEYVGTIHFKPSIAEDEKHYCKNVSRK